MRAFKLLLPVVLLVVCVSVLQADTIHVPSEQPTIQAGIDAAVDGDTVLVSDGTYIGDGNRDINFLGKAIVVMSENGAEACIIDCEGVGRGFYFHSREHSGSVVQCFTIQNGSSNEGGGISCENRSSPSILANRIIGNTAQSGGGIHCKFHSDAVIKGNIITENTATRFGGGIRCSYSSVTIKKNLIASNSAYSIDYGGGGIYCNNSPAPNIDGNTIIGNMATAGGGGIYCNGSSPTITNSILWDNEQGEIHGGGHNPTVSYCDIDGGWPGTGNINKNPRFVGGDPFDYHLFWGSPCIDAGDPNSPPDPDSTRADMGAYYYQNPWAVVPDTTHYNRTESLGFTVTATNEGDTAVFFQAWTEVETPGGINIIPSLGPIEAVVAGGETVTSHLTQYIPDYAPLGGPYIYRVKAGIFPDEVLVEDSFEFFIDPPNITLEVDPDTTHYHRGEMLGFGGTITSNEDTTVQFQSWSAVETPWGHTISPVLGPADTVLAAHETIQAYITQQVPNDAPFGGPYIYTAKIGTYPNEVWVEDSFEFSIVPWLELPEQKYEDWEVVVGELW